MIMAMAICIVDNKLINRVVQGQMLLIRLLLSCVLYLAASSSSSDSGSLESFDRETLRFGLMQNLPMMQTQDTNWPEVCCQFVKLASSTAVIAIVQLIELFLKEVCPRNDSAQWAFFMKYLMSFCALELLLSGFGTLAVWPSGRHESRSLHIIGLGQHLSLSTFRTIVPCTSMSRFAPISSQSFLDML